MVIQQRIDRSETFEELERQLLRLFPRAHIRRVQRHSGQNGESDEQPEDAREAVFRTTILLGSNALSKRNACEIISEKPFNHHEAKFLHSFGRVFNNDLEAAPRWRRDEELWLSLQQTRLARVIARFTPFHTEIFLRWLRAFESALSLRYEGQPFSTQVVLTKQVDWVRNNENAHYVRFSARMSLLHALFEEKWTRSLAADGDLALVGLGHDKGIVGVVYPEPNVQYAGKLVPPHSGLSSFCSLLVPGTLGLLASRRGDLRVLLPSGATFLKSQGHWTMVNPQSISDTLAPLLDRSVADALMRLVVDLSYEGHGALLCCIDDRSSIGDIVPDHSKKARVGRPLRLMSRHLVLTQSAHQKMLKRVAGIDGAIVMDAKGSVLDVACMISDPSDAALQKAGVCKRERFAGARSTAAWNASIHGLAIKVSEDGPITIFRQGRIILQL